MAYFTVFGLAAPFQQISIPTMSAAAMVSPSHYKWNEDTDSSKVPYNRKCLQWVYLLFVVENEVCGFNVCNLLDKSFHTDNIYIY